MTDKQGTTTDLMTSERSVFGGLGIAMLVLSLGSRSAVGKLILGTAGAALGYVALKGENPVAPALKIESAGDPGEILVREAVTIGKPAAELYAVWRDLKNLPRLMSNVESVEVLDDKRSKWTVKAPLGRSVGWEAELTAQEPGQRLAWQSLPGAVIDNSGEVLFRPAPGGRGTEVVVRLTYKPPLGSTGAVLARLFGKEPSQEIRDDLARFKAEQELGFAPTTNGQTSGRPDAGVKAKEESPKAQADQESAGQSPSTRPQGGPA